MGGTYKKFNIAKSDNVYNYVIDITKSGITYEAYSMSDMPTFDFSNITTKCLLLRGNMMYYDLIRDILYRQYL
ncbi:MAG: hypothetical protein P4L60_15075 [Clostridium sp.]|nr:hypothetical protein [Clostridium sp.]MDR3596080.1 hypothetical protein [Clostridium sp.]